MAGARTTAPSANPRFQPLIAAICLAGAAASPLMAALQRAPLRPVAAACPAGDALSAAVCSAAARPAPPYSIEAFYRARGGRPLWVGAHGLEPQARQLLAALDRAGDDGLDPARYRTPELEAAVKAARPGDPASLARAELALSQAIASYAADVHNGLDAGRPAYVDPALGLGPLVARAALDRAAAATSPAERVAAMLRGHPIYEALKARLVTFRSRWGALRPGEAPSPGQLRQFQLDHGLEPTDRMDEQTRRAIDFGPKAYEQLILANMARARLLPADPGPRYLVVDAAGQKVDLYEHGRVAHSMDVAVGKPSEPTPVFVAVMRSAVFNPYWNVPPDLVRFEVAPKVLAHGLSALEAQHMEVLSDFTEQAVVVDPSTVDWRAVADGRTILRVRQKPGPGNMMGRVKLMLPNPTGVYLHDTPMKYIFQAKQRNFSAGCIRLADALTMARWLMPNTTPPPEAPTETRVELARPVPVYVLYLTVAPTPDGLAFRKDVYGRDRELVARLAARNREALAAATAPGEQRRSG